MILSAATLALLIAFQITVLVTGDLGWPLNLAFPIVAGTYTYLLYLYRAPSQYLNLWLLFTLITLVPLSGLGGVWPFHFLIPLALWGAFAFFFSRLRKGIDWWQKGTWDRTSVFLILTIALVSGAALYWWKTILNPDLTAFRQMIPPWSGVRLALAGLGFAILNALMEEIIWRGFVMSAVQRVTSRVWLVVVLQAVSFGLVHWHGFPSGLSGVFLATLYGVMLGALRHKTRGLLCPIVAHVLTDLVIFGLLLL